MAKAYLVCVSMKSPGGKFILSSIQAQSVEAWGSSVGTRSGLATQLGPDFTGKTYEEAAKSAQAYAESRHPELREYFRWKVGTTAGEGA